MLISLKNLDLSFHNQSQKTLKDRFVSFFDRTNSEKITILKNITLDINEGDKLAIIGKNGAGKSSLLRVISRVYEPSAGFLKSNCSIAPLIEIASGFNLEFNGIQNIILNSLYLGVDYRELKKNLEKIILFSGLENHINTPIKYYSTGMQLKLAFSIAINVDADVLILDELFAGGDKDFRVKASNALNDKIKKTKALIFASHDPDLILKYATRAIVINDCQIQFNGKPTKALEFYNKL